MDLSSGIRVWSHYWHRPVEMIIQMIIAVSSARVQTYVGYTDLKSFAIFQFDVKVITRRALGEGRPPARTAVESFYLHWSPHIPTLALFCHCWTSQPGFRTYDVAERAKFRRKIDMVGSAQSCLTDKQANKPANKRTGNITFGGTARDIGIWTPCDFASSPA